MILRKLKLPIEMEYQGGDNDDLTAETDEPLDWNPESLLEHAKVMFRLKEKIYRRAGMNIKQAQEKDVL